LDDIYILWVNEIKLFQPGRGLTNGLSIKIECCKSWPTRDAMSQWRGKWNYIWRR